MNKRRNQGIAKRDRNRDFLKLAFLALVALSIISYRQDIGNILEALRFNFSVFW